MDIHIKYMAYSVNQAFGERMRFGFKLFYDLEWLFKNYEGVL